MPSGMILIDSSECISDQSKATVAEKIHVIHAITQCNKRLHNTHRMHTLKKKKKKGLFFLPISERLPSIKPSLFHSSRATFPRLNRGYTTTTTRRSLLPCRGRRITPLVSRPRAELRAWNPRVKKKEEKNKKKKTKVAPPHRGSREPRSG